MKILVLGAGMYVTGRGKSGIGTILCALAQASKTIPIHLVTVVARNPHSKKDVMEAMGRINQALNSSLNVGYESMDTQGAAFRSFLAKTPYDAAIICLPDHLHFNAAKAVLEAGIHCLVVKPLTPTVAMAKQLIAIQRRKKLYAAVEFHKRFDEINLSIKRAISEGLLGPINFFSVDYSQRIHIPLNVFKSWADKTNIFQYLGVHYVDLIYFLTGYIPIRAMAVGTKKVLVQKGVNTYDSVHALIEWHDPRQKKDMFISHLNTSWIDPNNTSALSDQKYKVIGAKGRIECDQKNRGIEVVQENLGTQHVNPYFSDYLYDSDGKLEFSGYGYKSLYLFVKDVRSLLNGKTTVDQLEQTRPSFHHSLGSTAIVETVNRSLKNQSKWISINDVF